MIINPIKIALIQDNPGSDIREPYLERLNEFRSDILAFPEYYFVGSQFMNVAESYHIRDDIMDRLRRWSRGLGCIIVGGTLVEEENGRRVNRCYLLNKGDVVGFYDKIHLYRNEGQGLLSPGSEYRVFEIGPWRIGLLICADVLYPDSFWNIRGLGPDIIFVPNTSQLRPGEPIEEKFRRDTEIFAEGANSANAMVVKVSASGVITGRRLQGRSLIALPGKIGWRIEPQNEDRSALVLATIGGDIRNPSLDIRVHRL